VLALQTGVEIVPGYISGSREVMPKGRLTIRPGPVRVRFGAPIPVQGMTLDQRDEITERAHAAVAAMAGPSDPNQERDKEA